MQLQEAYKRFFKGLAKKPKLKKKNKSVDSFYNKSNREKSKDTKNVKKLSRVISDIGMYEFKRELKYKAKLKGNLILENDRWFASSKTCPNCGNVKKDLTLKDRVYICDKCGFKADRDLSASINLHNQLPRVHREVKPVEIAVLNLSVGLIDLTSIVEAGIKHHLLSNYD